MTERILCVDDEPNVLQAFRRQLRKDFDIVTALGGQEGLDAISSEGPFAVIVSDMRMPGMDGIEFLSRVKQGAPDSVRIMLTGCADQQTAVNAVNTGRIFRFLAKPCPPELLATALREGIAQYRLITAERDLLQRTLGGAVKILTEVLALTNPVAFGYASRVRQLVGRVYQQLGETFPWQAEIAALLSQIGCVTVPSFVLEKAYQGKALTEDETQMLAKHPRTGADLVANIPRLEDVAAMIRLQHKCFNGSGEPADGPVGQDIPLGARVLKVALDYDALAAGGLSPVQAIVELHVRRGHYDPVVLEALEATVGFEEASEIKDLALKDLSTGMILAEDLLSTDGTLLVSKGQEVTTSLRERLKNFAQNGRITGTIKVLCTIRQQRAVAQPVNA